MLEIPVAKRCAEHRNAKLKRVGSTTPLQQLWCKQFGEGDRQRGKGYSRSLQWLHIPQDLDDKHRALIRHAHRDLEQGLQGRFPPCLELLVGVLIRRQIRIILGSRYIPIIPLLQGGGSAEGIGVCRSLWFKRVGFGELRGLR